jgi:hypothetical protein
MKTTIETLLSSGEWEALIHNTADQAKHLLIRLAIHHGAVEPPSPAECPLCSAKIASAS